MNTLFLVLENNKIIYATNDSFDAYHKLDIHNSSGDRALWEVDLDSFQSQCLKKNDIRVS